MNPYLTLLLLSFALSPHTLWACNENPSNDESVMIGQYVQSIKLHFDFEGPKTFKTQVQMNLPDPQGARNQTIQETLNYNFFLRTNLYIEPEKYFGHVDRSQFILKDKAAVNQFVRWVKTNYCDKVQEVEAFYEGPVALEDANKSVLVTAIMNHIQQLEYENAIFIGWDHRFPSRGAVKAVSVTYPLQQRGNSMCISEGQLDLICN